MERLISSRLFTRKLVDVKIATGRSSGSFSVDRPSHPGKTGTVVWSFNSRENENKMRDPNNQEPFTFAVSRK